MAGQDNPSVPALDPSLGIDEAAKEAPVYDERGNVRPRGTKGARKMSYAERVAIAQGIEETKSKARTGTRRRTSKRSS